MLSRSRGLARTLTITVILNAAAAAFAQLAPPPQTHVANIGATPLRAGQAPQLSPGATFTMEGWFYLTEARPFAWLMGKSLPVAGVDPFVSFALMLGSDGSKLSYVSSNGLAGSYRELASPSAFPLRTWTHVAAVQDGSSTRLLINGSVVATGTAAGAPANTPSVPFAIGVAYLENGASNYQPFPGYARQIRFWNVARSAAEILAAASQPSPTNGNGLVAYWPLDENGGSLAVDRTTNGNSLTVPSGTLSSTRLAVLEAGPFFAVTTTTPPANSLANVDDAILIDFDNDGDPDLVTQHIAVPPTVPETRVRLRAFRNTNNAFADVTDAVLGEVTMVHPRDRYVADFNGDTRADLLIVGHGTDTPPFPGEQSKLLIQSADGRLVDETASRLPARNSFTHNLAVGDIDGDGDLDLYLANVFGGSGGPSIYLNNGSGVFTEALDRLPADVAARNSDHIYTAAALVDVNSDQRPDLVLGGENTAPENALLLNDGSGRFVRDAGFTLPPKLLGANAVTVAIVGADLNADGAQDLVLSTTGGRMLLPDGRTIYGYEIAGVQLLLNRGDGTFYDATPQLNLAFNATTDTWVEWIRVTDLNGDARPDLVFQGAPSATGQAFSRTILLNRGGAVFVDASEAYAGGSVTYLQPGDINRDGLVDLVGVNHNAIVVSRGLKPLDRALFQTTADDPGRLANLSVRTQAGTDDQTLIAGFALSGPGTKSLLVRAVGPTLGSFGVAGFLPDPQVEIAPQNQPKIVENDNWGNTSALAATSAAAGAFPLLTDHDAALQFAPSAGAYTAKVAGMAAPGSTQPITGVALVEVYDTGTGNTPRLTNVSARTQVGTGTDVLIVGFVVNGNVPKKLLIRAVGPTLGAFGVGGTLADPVLHLRPLGSENIVATNDDWRGTPALKSAFMSVGAFALGAEASKDAALAIELPPGAYTATVSGRADTTGVALVEVYELP